MKVLSLTNIYSPFKAKTFNDRQTTTYTNNPFINKQRGDVVSFTAKAYNANSIANPTNHCAYCGCKVYNESQIDGLAKEMLKDGSHRLQGDIKSVLEKLETAERSYELTIAKQLENKKEIEFFKKFLEQAEDKSFLKGDAIFAQVYGMENDEALETLKRNMRPLTKTVDHVSPQNLDEDNKDSDINLVEACYCCNHDLKKGMPFEEFYTMYPSIKENMPVDKFKFAHSKLMASSSSSILSRVSASSLLKYISGLFEQRVRAISQLDNVDFRISESKVSVEHSIETCKGEIAEKEAEIEQLKAKLQEMTDDEEYNAMVMRIRLLQQKSSIEAELAALRDRRANASSALNDLKNPPKKNKKARSNLSKDQIEQKIAGYRQLIIELKAPIEEKEKELATNQADLEALDELFPTVEILQGQKSSYESVVTAYSQLLEETNKSTDLARIHSLLEFDISELEREITSLPKDSFDVTKYSKEDQARYSEYMSLLEALKYIEQHANSGGVKSVVNRTAKVQIEQEIKALESYPVIIDAKSSIKKKSLAAQKAKKQEEKADIEKRMSSTKNRIQSLGKVTSKCSLQTAKDEIQYISTSIRRLNDKQNYLKIPSTIEKLEAEILILRSIISDLSVKQEQITSLGIQ